ncbi:MAG TPA: serine protease [Opitutaceae bacterium]|nr:serine protease [Opitutaceae bacterium]
MSQTDNTSRIDSNDLHWAEATERVGKYTFMIRTPQGHGSGFLITTRKTGLCGIATAWHVVQHADEWSLPIKILHHATGKEMLLKEEDRYIYRRSDRDVALIIFSPQGLDSLPIDQLELAPQNKSLRQGLSVGWLGFPALRPSLLCFFEGKVSAWDEATDSYLIDGVAINGVSGGPVFRSFGSFTNILGCVSAYIPNRSTGESLPGLCVVQSITPFHGFLENIKSIEEAKDKAVQEGADQSKANQALVPTPMPVTPAAGAPVAPATGAAHL